MVSNLVIIIFFCISVSPQREANLARVPTEGLHRRANCEMLFLLSASKALLLSFALSPFGASGGVCYYGGREVRNWLSVVIVCVDDGCLSCTFGTVFRKPACLGIPSCSWILGWCWWAFTGAVAHSTRLRGDTQRRVSAPFERSVTAQGSFSREWGEQLVWRENCSFPGSWSAGKWMERMRAPLELGHRRALGGKEFQIARKIIDWKAGWKARSREEEEEGEPCNMICPASFHTEKKNPICSSCHLC